MGFFSFSRSKKRYSKHYGGHHYKREGLMDKLGRMLRSHSYSSRHKRRYGHSFSSYSGRHYSRPYGYKRRYHKSSWS